MTLSQIETVQGEAGNFTVKIKKNPRFVDEEKCIACGLCAQKCPKKVDDEYNMGLNKRKAAHIKYGQTVPLKYAIDAKNCIYQTRGKCGVCVDVCPTGAINHDMKTEYIDIKVGAIILAPGFKPFSPSGIDYYGYDEIPDVVTSLEYERMLAASGPSMGHLKKESDGKEPNKVAWIQCVGSRNTNGTNNGYCSSVCCMYAIKQAVMTQGHLPQGKSDQTIFYMDIRTPGKEYERYYETSRQKGVRYIKARPHTLLKGPDGSGVTLTWTDDTGKNHEDFFDMVVLSIGIQAPEDAMDLARKCHIELDPFKFAKTNSFDPVATTLEGIFVTGSFQSPKAIPQSIASASTAAARVKAVLAEARDTLTIEKKFVEEFDISGQEKRIGVFVCSCGNNISSVVDVNAVALFAKSLPGVAYVDNQMFTCSADTQDLIAQTIKDKNLNAVVIAACTPRTHEPLFQETLQNIGLNKYMVEMANIRNMNAWVHPNEPEKATAKAKQQVKMAIAKVTRNFPLADILVNITPRALVVGGGLAGMSAAHNLANQGYETILIEREADLGGVANTLLKTWKDEDIQTHLAALKEKVTTHKGIRVLTQTTLTAVAGFVGSFTGELNVNGSAEDIEFGACIIATGGNESKPAEYLYNQDDRVMTSLEINARMKTDPDWAQKITSAVFIQCVGSRNQYHPYCSRVCCTQSIKKAVRLKKMNPQMDIFILYRDIRTYADMETVYRQARDLGVIFIKYTRDAKPVVKQENSDLLVDLFDPILQRIVSIKADLIVLATAIVPNDTTPFVNLFKCSANADGFLMESHPKLKPVDSTVDGVFLAGICHYPKPIDEAISQGRAAASRASVILSKKTLKLDAIKSCVTHNCDGCALCVDICPYNAIELVEYQDEHGKKHRRIKTQEALCKGCGICAATCPKEGVVVNGFTLNQLKAQVDAILEKTI
ncbi:MAG: CoB--CoM heterodisulfide reductase iron-sulfur subunit A family protein [Desulfobacula sp.]|nr:CoB--CoM heterodisulfide reductase iron-sulfur subunit A family protein [Desulfobacula sp.]